jgi:aspartyl/asparaginyl beta-hydroxylase (cupin superfamily)
MDASDAATQKVLGQAVALLRSGNLAAAVALFGEATSKWPRDPTTWMGLAVARDRQGDGAAVLAALDRVLDLDPDNLPALLMKADRFAAAGQPRQSAAFYRAVVERAPPLDQLPPRMRPEIERAAAAVQRYAADYERDLLGILQQAGMAAKSNSRFAQSIDLMLGKKTLFYQSPTLYNFPGLPQIQFYDRADFAWTQTLERQVDVMTKELLGLLEADGAFQPYIEPDPNMPPSNFAGMLGDPSWSAAYLIRNGVVNAEIAERCPQTLAALQALPLCDIDGRTPSALFSLLRPGAHIPPHCGMLNTRLICHLPLITPPACELRVGNDVRPWIRGETLIFDDSIQHEAWNRSDQLRVVLLFDVWRPELSEQERALVRALFAAVDAYGVGDSK